LSTLIVALSETYRYGSKAEQHGLASESYENLRTKLFFKSLQLQTLVSENGADKAVMTPCDFKAFFSSVEDQITEIARQCKDLVPNSIIRNYKENRFGDTVESLARNLRTIMAQDRFARVVDKLSKGLELTQADVEEVQNLEKLAKQSKKKRMLDQV
jgi:predicted GNAT family acetyltransferase